MKTQPLLPVLLGEGQPPHLFRLYIALAKHTGRLELWRGAGLTLPFAVTGSTGIQLLGKWLVYRSQRSEGGKAAHGSLTLATWQQHLCFSHLRSFPPEDSFFLLGVWTRPTFLWSHGLHTPHMSLEYGKP